jgi:DNA (cytosine-5)-methyltransferase 1
VIGRRGERLRKVQHFYTNNNQLTLTERYNVDTTKEITHLSLCTGYEGLGLGLRRVLPNLREIAYVEREGFPIANLVAKIESGQLDAAPIFTDVKTFPYGKFRGCVDILSGGFPCQPFSAAGKRQATEDPRHLFPYIADGIRDCQPQIVFLENVEGIISAKTGDGESVLQYVLRQLEGLGYRATAGVFSASEVGAPHQRKRVYILGVSNAISSRLRGRRDSKECGDDIKRIQGNKGERHELRSETEGCGLDFQFPARPNEPQREWEEARTITELGGTVDGSSCGVDATANRLDRLRACGNGVVPQTAAKAFLTLINRVI